MARTAFSEKLIEIIKAIPRGKVATYGQIAAMAGSPLGARQVVRILVSLSGKEGLPWHRVINSKGEISLGGEGFRQQKELLEAEGVRVDGKGRVDLKIYRWEGED
jgi:methylated-DNA-protein-cysteine methyltransferase-like protein